MTNVALSHNLAVVFGQLEEVGNLHGTLIAVLTLTHRHNTIGDFLLANDQEVRHLLEFALADLVAELLTPSASAAAPRSCQNASILSRHSACTLLVAFIDFRAKNVGSKEAYVCECYFLIDERTTLLSSAVMSIKA